MEIDRPGGFGSFRPKTSHYWRSDVCLKHSRGIMSEHRFPDTVQEHVFQDFSELAGRNRYSPPAGENSLSRPRVTGAVATFQRFVAVFAYEARESYRIP
jgi:hypothetical protein